MYEDTRTIIERDYNVALRKAQALEAEGWTTKSCFKNSNGVWVITMRRFLKKKSKKN